MARPFPGHRDTFPWIMKGPAIQMGQSRPQQVHSELLSATWTPQSTSVLAGSRDAQQLCRHMAEVTLGLSKQGQCILQMFQVTWRKAGPQDKEDKESELQACLLLVV